MNKGANIAIGMFIVAALAAGGGYWAGSRGARQQGGASMVAGDAGGSGKQQRKVLYYRNPMGLSDTSPVPKKDPMGMDYTPVYAGEEDAGAAAANQIAISADKVQKLGVRTEKASMKALGKTVRAAGRIEPDERRVVAVTPKFEGYVERLFVNATGQAVSKGQALFEMYSPELVSAQREYAIAAQGAQSLKGAGSEAQEGMRQLAESSLMRLKNWDISEEQIRTLAKSGATRRTLTYRSPVAGIVMEKKAVQGMRFMPGDALYQVVDLSTVWVLADVPEQDIGLVKAGAKAMVGINAYPGKEFAGTVTYVYPTMNAATRTAQVRVELPNPDQRLKPGMFANVEMAVAARSEAVTVPVSAVIDSGTRQVVLVQVKEGHFAPREVRLGARSDNDVEVLEGVKAGEDVVVAANFLVDAESNLKAALGSFGHAGHGDGAVDEGAQPGKPGHANGAVGHKGEGVVEKLNAQRDMVDINHGQIASLKWPAMTMGFKIANSALLQQLKPGARIAFEIVERQPGEWVVTSVQPVAGGKADAKAPAANQHAGH